jgi:hypothetical protein
VRVFYAPISFYTLIVFPSCRPAPPSQSGWQSSESIGFSSDKCSRNSAKHFQQFCSLPFDGSPHQIDADCGHCGDAADSNLPPDKLNAEMAQNFQKTNLCSPSDSPVDVTPDDLKKLQEGVNHIPNFKYGNVHAGGFGPPLDRAPLKAMSPVNGKHLQEGMVVRLAGFMVEEHYSPTSASQHGESVNCGESEHTNVDIHIALGTRRERIPKHATSAEKEPILCPTITAEMIPHFRPDDWEFAQLEAVSDREVRVTGQLFFDGSHRACGDPHRASTDPKRISSWEIHPVYAFEVCKRASGGCDINQDSDWKSITDALAEIQDENDEP